MADVISEFRSEKKRRFRRLAKALGGGTIVFFAVKGLITTSIIAGAAFGVKGCFF